MATIDSANIIADGDRLDDGFFNDTSSVIQVTAGENLTAGWVVYIKRSNGQAYQSDTNTADDIRADGMVVATALSGATVKVQTRGVFSGSSGLTAGTQYYLGASGTLSATASGVMVGVATSTTSIWLDIRDDKEAMIGTIKTWHKSITGLPTNTLTAYWHECSSSAISDAESPLNGRTIDLNSTPRFLRGSSTSGSTGGSDTHNHGGVTGAPSETDYNGISGTAPPQVPTDVHTHTISSASSLPAYTDMVFIIKKK